VTPDADDAPDTDDTDSDEPDKKNRGAVREAALLLTIAVVLYYVMLTFIARPYLIPSQSMEPTLHGCTGCVGDRIMVDKVTYDFSSPERGDVVVFKGPPSWNIGYKSIRSDVTVVRWFQNALSFVGFVPPDENDLVKRIIAVGGQTVECHADTGLRVDGKALPEPYLDSATIGGLTPLQTCLFNGNEWGPVTVPDGRLWVMGDNRTQSADSRAHCTYVGTDAMSGHLCTGDATAGTVPVDNVIGKARFIAWPPTRWGGVGSADHGVHVVLVPVAILAGVCLLIWVIVRTVRRRT
jgi:signal peptidase I